MWQGWTTRDYQPEHFVSTWWKRGDREEKTMDGQCERRSKSAGNEYEMKTSVDTVRDGTN